jgi:hypothetical protein
MLAAQRIVDLAMQFGQPVKARFESHRGLLIDEIKQVTPMPDPGLRGEVGQASVSPDAVRHHVAEETSADARGARPA